MEPKDQLDIELASEKKPEHKQPVRHSHHPARQKTDLLNVLVIGTLVTGTALWFLFGTRPTESEIENRNLAKFPSFSWSDYISGKYTADIANYYNDTVPKREWFKNLTASMRRHMGVQMEDDVKFYGTLHVNKDSEPETTELLVTTQPIHTQVGTEPVTTAQDQPAVSQQITAATTVAVEENDDSKEDGEISNNILIYKKRGIMLYGGSYAAGRNYASYVNAYKSDLGENVNVYSMVIPTPCSYYMPDKYKNLIGSEQGNIDNINQYLDGVEPVNVYDILGQHTDELIYPRTDHHWGAIAAYYAAQEFASVAQVPFRDISQFEKITKPGYVGTLYGYSGDIVLKDNPEDFVYYAPQEDYTTTYYNSDMSNERTGRLLINLEKVKPVSWYLVYMGSDDRITHIQTSARNGRTLCIVKDSYGNALTPYFMDSFEDIYVIDMRYFKPNAISFMKEHNVTDVLFAMNTFSATGPNAKKIEQIRTQ
ncbi:DHHW family protein [Ruminococcus champanellensis]|uniref:DHHW family protein n=1 Tax=Ruminococcus champanellensis TaxID=1161942 RepID=UPI0026DC7A1C|nr:DHHW family protein [Ruminococcus champanellensis]